MENKLLKDLIKNLNDPNKKYCEKCDIIIHRASYAKHLRSKKHLNKLQNDNEKSRKYITTNNI